VVERFDVEVTFYRHAIDGAIQAINAQTQLDLRGYALTRSTAMASRAASTGAVSSFNNRPPNFGSIKTDGWDVDLFWTLPQSSIGQFKLGWKNTFVGRYGHRCGRPEAAAEARVEVADSSIPEWTSNASIAWTLDRWSANLDGAAHLRADRELR
jgi:iron complex outermembrane receptor protein